MRIASCGLMRVKYVDWLIEILNVANFAVGADVPPMRYSTGTVGCVPSFNSLLVDEMP